LVALSPALFREARMAAHEERVRLERERRERAPTATAGACFLS
jgi:hypothetical protein